MVGLALILISIINGYGKLQNSETASGEVGQEMRSRNEITDAERASQAQSNANQTESKSLAWYEKGKIRQFISI